MTDDLCERIDRLEREKRWWKRLATVAITALGTVLLVGGSICVFQYQQAQTERLRAEQLAAKVRARLDAAQRAMDAARRAGQKGEGKAP
jgi:hypothetical protein